MYIGTGDQDNYVQIVLSGDNGGSVQVMKEIGGVFTRRGESKPRASRSGFRRSESNGRSGRRYSAGKLLRRRWATS